MYQLQNTVRNYAWGSRTALADALGRPASGQPEAEFWVGAHRDSPSVAETADGQVPLTELIAADPQAALGNGEELPFLLKVLAAQEPLSLQVHPDKQQAAAGFAAEEAGAVAHTAPERNYKDENHKPEMLLALTEFEALCGFRPVTQSGEDFRDLAEQTGDALLAAVAADLDEPAGLRRAFSRLAGAGDLVPGAVRTAVAHIGAQDRPGSARQTVLDLAQRYPEDPGTLISLLLNRVHLTPGTAISMPAGHIHAYLSGLGIEAMASSDNVLRGGLTPKHVDVPELLRIVDFAPQPVSFVPPVRTGLGQEVYDAGYEDFALQRIALSAAEPDVPLIQNGALLVLVLDGGLMLDSPRADLALGKGGSAFAMANEAPVNAHLAEGFESALAVAVTGGGVS